MVREALGWDLIEPVKLAGLSGGTSCAGAWELEPPALSLARMRPMLCSGRLAARFMSASLSGSGIEVRGLRATGAGRSSSKLSSGGKRTLAVEVCVPCAGSIASGPSVRFALSAGMSSSSLPYCASSSSSNIED